MIFEAGTEIACIDGWKPIEMIQPNDTVFALNPYTNPFFSTLKKTRVQQIQAMRMNRYECYSLTRKNQHLYLDPHAEFLSQYNSRNQKKDRYMIRPINAMYLTFQTGKTIYLYGASPHKPDSYDTYFFSEETKKVERAIDHLARGLEAGRWYSIEPGGVLSIETPYPNESWYRLSHTLFLETVKRGLSSYRESEDRSVILTLNIPKRMIQTAEMLQILFAYYGYRAIFYDKKPIHLTIRQNEYFSAQKKGAVQINKHFIETERIRFNLQLEQGHRFVLTRFANQPFLIGGL